VVVVLEVLEEMVWMGSQVCLVREAKASLVIQVPRALWVAAVGGNSEYRASAVAVVTAYLA
jgi:hypothetical protein